MSEKRLRPEVHHGRIVRAHASRPGCIDEFLDRALTMAPNRTAIVDGPLRLSYRDLDAHVRAVAGLLRGLAVKAGDRIALLLANRADFAVAVLAAARIGAIIVPMNIRQRRPETAYAINDAGAVLLIHEASLAKHLPAAADVPTLRHRVAVDDVRHIWLAKGADVRAGEAASVGQDDPFAILYTSGTTGRPKGAIITHFNAVSSVIGAGDALGLGDGEVSAMAVPASHVTGLVLIFLNILGTAGTTVMMREFKAARFLELAERERVTFMCMVPTMYALCLMEPDYARHDLSHWRAGTFGGAPMPEATLERLAQHNPHLRLTNIYGATETTSPAVMMPSDAIVCRRHQVGRQLPYCEILIMDEEGREVPRGAQGEIWLAGPMVIPGYWNSPDATAEAFVDGYWRSGDLGALDEDGYLQLFDRKKDMLNRGGFKIYSVEVENVLMSHPDVIEAGVVGRPCPVLGERVEAFVSSPHGAVTEASLRAFCAERLSDYKVPEAITISADPLPRNANGKLLKTELRQMLLAEQRAT